MSILAVEDEMVPLDSAGGGGKMVRYRISHNGKFCLTNAMVKRLFGVFAVKIVEYRSKLEIFITNSFPYNISDTATLRSRCRLYCSERNW